MSKMWGEKGTGVIIQNEWLAVVPTRQINLLLPVHAGNINIYHGIRTENKMNGTYPISSTSNYMISIASTVSLMTVRIGQNFD